MRIFGRVQKRLPEPTPETEHALANTQHILCSSSIDQLCGYFITTFAWAARFFVLNFEGPWGQRGRGGVVRINKKL